MAAACCLRSVLGDGGAHSRGASADLYSGFPRVHVRERAWWHFITRLQPLGIARAYVGAHDTGRYYGAC